MKNRPLFGILIGILLISISSTLATAKDEQLFLDASIDFDRRSRDIVVNITGRVFDENGTSIQNAEISVQVNDPFNSSVHVAFIHSDQNGTFYDNFKLSLDSPLGEYPVYLTASKPGYLDVIAELSFRNISPEFFLIVEPAYSIIEQGDSAIYNITVEANYNATIQLSIAGLPEHFEYDISPNPLIGSSKANLNITSLPQTTTGVYNLTITGSSNIGSKHYIITVTVKSREKSSFLYPGLILIVVATGITAFYMGYVKRRRKRPPPERPTKRYYAEGLPIDSEALMQMSDHLRKTAMVLCNIREATADEVSMKTGRARAVESDYLNQLVNLNHIKKKRKGRKVYFYV